jgi:Icc-related predicted phosphoesterase
MKIAAIGDIHCRVYTHDLIETLFVDIQKKADVLVITGDLTDAGLPEEAHTLADQLKHISVPVLAVLGNHDHENGKEHEIKAILTDAGIIVLDANAYEIGDVGFAGAKGFCGGFGKNLMQPFGEKAMKKFVQTGIDEALELESVLARLECKHKVAILHYAPIKATLEGESPEIYPFLGSELLETALDRRGVDLALHGHAHHGTPHGHTSRGIPVFNVSRYVLEHHYKRDYCVFDLENDDGPSMI